MNSKERIFYYDFLRALAIAAVVLCHVDGMISYSVASLKLALPGLFSTIAFTGVPIFLMLTGALLFNRTYSLSQFFKRRFSRIIYPFLFWMLITITAGVFFFGWSNQDVLNEFFGITSHTWYIWTLIGVYLFMPVVNAFIKVEKIRGVEFFLAIWFITILSGSYYPDLLKPLKLINFSGFFGYTVLGYYLDNKEFGLSDKAMLYCGIIIFIAFTLFHMFLRFNEIKIYSEYYLNFITLFQSIGVFLTIRYWDGISVGSENLYNRIKSGLIGKFIVSVSMCSYGMYFAHYILIKYFEQFNIHSLKLWPVLFVVIFLASWLVTYVFGKIPYIKRVSGVN